MSHTLLGSLNPYERNHGHRHWWVKLFVMFARFIRIVSCHCVHLTSEFGHRWDVCSFIGCCHLDWNKEKKTSVHQINISFFAVGQDAFLKTHLCLNAKKQDDGQISNVLSWKREIWSKRVLLQRPLTMWLLLRKIRTVKLERCDVQAVIRLQYWSPAQYSMNTTHYEVTWLLLCYCHPVIISEIKVI